MRGGPRRAEARSRRIQAMEGTKVKVLFIHTKTLPPLGADTWIHAQILRHLDRQEHDVHVACATNTRRGPTPTFEALREIPDLEIVDVDLGPELSGRTGRDRVVAACRTVSAIGGLLRLAVFIRRRGVTVLHTSDRPRDAFAAVVLGRLTGAVSIIHVHVAYGDWMSPLLKWALKRSDALVAISEFVASTLVESGHRGDRIQVVRNGIDVDAWRPLALAPANVRAALGIPDDAPVILTVCRLFPSKGPAELIRVLPAILAVHPATRLVIVGQEMVAGFLDELRALAEALDVSSHVLFTGRREDVAALMAAADVFAMPSVGEPFGLVYAEAMAMGLPVVALRSGGAPEVVAHGVTGLLSAPGDRAGLLEHLLTLLDRPDRRDAMGRRGRERVESEFTSQRMAEDVEAVYRCRLARSKATSGGVSA